MWSYLKFLHVVWRYSQPWMSLAANKLQIPFVMNTSSHTRMYICTQSSYIGYTYTPAAPVLVVHASYMIGDREELAYNTNMNEWKIESRSDFKAKWYVFVCFSEICCLSVSRATVWPQAAQDAGWGGKLKLIKHGRWGNLGLILVVWQEEPTNQVFYSILFGKFRVWCCNLHIELFPRSHARPTRIKRATESLQSSAWLPAPIEPGKAMKTAEPRRILRWCADINSTILAMAS